MMWAGFGRTAALSIGLALVAQLSINGASAEKRTPQVPKLQHDAYRSVGTLEMIVISFGIDATARFEYGTNSDLSNATKTRAEKIKGSKHGTWSRASV